MFFEKDIFPSGAKRTNKKQRTEKKKKEKKEKLFRKLKQSTLSTIACKQKFLEIFYSTS